MPYLDHAYYVRVKDRKVKQKYTTIGRANEGAKYRGGDVYGVDIINGKPKIVAKYSGICQEELEDWEAELL